MIVVSQFARVLLPMRSLAQHVGRIAKHEDLRRVTLRRSTVAQLCVSGRCRRFPRLCSDTGSSGDGHHRSRIRAAAAVAALFGVAVLVADSSVTGSVGGVLGQPEVVPQPFNAVAMVYLEVPP